MQRLKKIRKLLVICIAVILATWYGLIVARLIANLSVLKQVDFVATYSAGYIAQYQGLPNIYNLDMQKRVEAAATHPIQLIRFYPYNHPPFLARILQLITSADYTATFCRWIFVLVFFHLLSLILFVLLLRQWCWHRNEIWLAAISGLLFYPLFTAYLKGQDSVFVLFGVVLWTYGLLTAKDKLAGLGLVLAAMRPQIALVLALPFLFKRQKIWWWFIAWGLIFLLYFYLLIGAQGLKDFIQLLFLSGEGKGIDVNAMPTLMGAIIRAFPSISEKALHITGYSGYIGAILFLCFVWLKSREIRYKQIGLAVLMGIIFSPHLHVHDLSLLLVPAMGAAMALVERKILVEMDAILLLLCSSLVFAVNGVFWSFTTIYIIIFLLGLLLWIPGGWKSSQENISA